MTIYTTLQTFPANLREQVILIGNFDGLHKGHQTLITRGKDIAAKMGKELIVLTFEPHPRLLFRPDDQPFRLTPAKIKFRKLMEYGVDHIIAIPFDWDFASQSADDFIHRILLQTLSAAHIIVGDDFRFGQLRQGTPQMIENAGITVTAISPEMNEEGKIFSSSRIRQALRRGEIEEANKMLGWEWEIEGPVTHGDKRGREIGYPTANIMLGETLHPSYGIYAGWAQVEEDDTWWPTAINIGIRPMFELQQGQVEAHILDGFDRDIYDLSLRVKPVRKIRGEAKFESLDALIEQIDRDCKTTLEILKSQKQA